MTTHDLKTHLGPFAAVVLGAKRYEVRENDRGFHVGDVLRLREWDAGAEAYTGREVVARVTYMTPGGSFGLPDGLCVMSIVLEGEPRARDARRSSAKGGA